MTKKKLLNKSGLETEDGRDIIIEISAKEFKEWVKQYGINIDIVASIILDGYRLRTNDYAEHRKYLRRIGYVAFVELNTKQKVTKDEKQWQKFLDNLKEYL